MNYQTQQLIETVTAMMMMAMGFGMVKPVMLQADTSGVWVVTLDKNNRWHCFEDCTWDSATSTASELMNPHELRRDLSRAKIVVTGGMPYLAAPEYRDLSVTRETPRAAWVVEAPNRYRAMQIAKKSWKSGQISEGISTISPIVHQE